jgi:hypothetical protein
MQRRITKAFAFRLATAVAVLFFLSEVVHPQGVLNASSAHAALCSIAACPSTTPVISSLDQASVVTPGGKLVLNGAHFNSQSGQPGKIVLKLGSRYPLTVMRLGSPNTFFHQPYMERQLTVLAWADSHAFAQIPADITGVMDGPATVEIWRDDGVKSKTFVISFTATRDFQILPLSDVTIQTCEAKADANLCNHWSDSSQLTIPAKVPWLGAEFSIFGLHTMFIPNPKTDQVIGTDQYSFDLKNGWVLDESSLGENGVAPVYQCDFSDAPVNEDFPNSKPPTAPSSSGVRVFWKAGCSTQYAIALHITGPIGVPWK